jgi:outer membrane lipoprotein-sorting protein
MKYVLIILVLLNSGCAGMARFLNDQDAAQQMQQASDKVSGAQYATSPTMQHGVDMNCQQQCLSRGYMLGLCQKNCSY